MGQLQGQVAIVTGAAQGLGTPLLVKAVDGPSPDDSEMRAVKW